MTFSSSLTLNLPPPPPPARSLLRKTELRYQLSRLSPSPRSFADAFAAFEFVLGEGSEIFKVFFSLSRWLQCRREKFQDILFPPKWTFLREWSRKSHGMSTHSSAVSSTRNLISNCWKFLWFLSLSLCVQRLRNLGTVEEDIYDNFINTWYGSHSHSLTCESCCLRGRKTLLSQ